MDKLKTYRSYIIEILEKHANFNPIGNWQEYENQVINDNKRDHYCLIRVGWKEYERSHHCVIHIDIKQDKIWIQEDWTEEGVANELVEKGVPKSDIVLAFYAPYRREDTEFAVV